MDKIICRMPEPYPEVTSCGKNEHDIACIRPLYAGNLGEITAIMQYVYQHVVLEKECDEVSEILMHISMVEMHHMEMLADAICTLGGNPKYWNPNANCMWSAGTVFFDNCMCKALLKNLQDETDAHKAYLATAKKVQNQSLAALLCRIAADEKLHMEIFTNLINCHCRKHH